MLTTTRGYVAFPPVGTARRSLLYQDYIYIYTHTHTHIHIQDEIANSRSIPLSYLPHVTAEIPLFCPFPVMTNRVLFYDRRFHLWEKSTKICRNPHRFYLLYLLQHFVD